MNLIHGEKERGSVSEFVGKQARGSPGVFPMDSFWKGLLLSRADDVIAALPPSCPGGKDAKA